MILIFLLSDGVLCIMRGVCGEDFETMLGLGKGGADVELKVVTIDPILMRHVIRLSGSDEDDDVVLIIVRMTSHFL